MPSYSIINNAVFQPFTYQELALPLMQMQQKQEALEEEYDKLSAQADILEAMGRNDRDIASGAYSKYKAFSDELRARADALYENGLDYDSRVRLHEMKRMYNTDIVPIQNAWQKRELESKMQMDAWSKDPSLMFSRDASKTNLDWYLDNPTGGYTTISGANIRNYVATAATNLQKKIMSSPQDAIKLQKEDPELYYSLTRYGLSPETVKDWQNHPMLKQIVEDALTANGVTPEKLGSNYENIYRQSLSHAGMGVWSAVGEDKIDWHTPPSAKSSGSGSGSGIDALGGLSPFPGIVQELPLIMADKKFQKETEAHGVDLGFAKNGGEIDKNGAYKFAKNKSVDSVLGYASDVLQHGLKTPGNKFTSSLPVLTPYRDYVPDKAPIYDKNKRLLTRDQFVAQAKNDNDKAVYGKWYDQHVTPALQHFGFDIGDTPYARELAKAYKETYDSGYAGSISGLDITLDKPEDWRKLGSQLAYPIKGYSRNGGMRVSDNGVKFSTVLDKVKDSSNSANITKTFLTNHNGDTALVFEVVEGDNATQYRVGLDTLGNSYGRYCKQALKDAQEAEAYAKQYEGTILGLQFAAKAEDLYKQAIAYTINSLGTYGSPTYNTYKQPTSKQTEE